MMQKGERLVPAQTKVKFSCFQMDAVKESYRFKKNSSLTF